MWGLQSRFGAYAFALAVTLATLAGRVVLAGWIGDRPLLLLFVLPIILSAYAGGLGPGLFATAVAALSVDYFILPPVHSFLFERTVDFVTWLILVIEGVLISVLIESLHRARGALTRPLKSNRNQAAQWKVQAGFAVALLCLGTIGIMSDLSVSRLKEDAALLRQEDEVVGRLHTLLAIVTDAETAQRGYIITGDDSYLEPLRNGAAALPGEFQALNKLAALRADGGAAFVKLEALVKERMNLLQQGIELRQREGFAAVQAKMLKGAGKQLHDLIRRTVADEVSDEQQRLRQREDRVARASLIARCVIVGGGVLAFVVVTLALFAISQDFAGSRRAELALLEAKDLLEERVRERTEELKESNTEVADSERRYRVLFEYAPDGIVIADQKSRYIDANESMCRMLGYTRDELIGLHASDIVAQSEIQHIEPALDVIKAKAEYHREWMFRRKDGSTFEAEVIATMMPDGNLLGMIRDITERKQAERRLGMRNSVSRVLADTTTLAEATPDVIRAICEAELWDFGTIWEVDKISTVLCCRETWHHPDFNAGDGLAEQTRALTFAIGHGLPGRVWASGEMELIPDVAKDNGYVRAKIATVAGLHSALAFPILVEGSVIGVMDFNAREIRRPDGQLVEMLAAIGRQVGLFIERHRAENQVRQLNADLEKRVSERTVQLESANKELEAFSYSVSHDLRAPLRTVDGFSQAVLEDYGEQLPDEGKRYLQTIRRGAQQMGELIDDLLKFARLSRATMEVDRVDMNRLMRTALSDLHFKSDDPRVELLCGELPACTGDSALLRQVWVNLLSNALKYTGRRDKAVIEIGSQKQDRATVYFVRDNGAGFDMRYADKLFGVFQRLHRAEDYEGTGVGLAIVQRIVHRHGGRVWAEAEEDRGATFYFTLEERKLS